jgi:hypothetical protein
MNKSDFIDDIGRAREFKKPVIEDDGPTIHELGNISHISAMRFRIGSGASN